MIVFDRNHDYFDTKPAMKRLIFQNIPESGAQRLLLEKGDVDVAVNLNATDQAAIRAGTAARIHASLSDELMHLGFNQGRKPFNDPRVVAAHFSPAQPARIEIAT